LVLTSAKKTLTTYYRSVDKKLQNQQYKHISNSDHVFWLLFHGFTSYNTNYYHPIFFGNRILFYMSKIRNTTKNPNRTPPWKHKVLPRYLRVMQQTEASILNIHICYVSENSAYMSVNNSRSHS